MAHPRSDLNVVELVARLFRASLDLANRERRFGLEVHRATIVVSVLGWSGKLAWNSFLSESFNHS